MPVKHSASASAGLTLSGTANGAKNSSSALDAASLRAPGAADISRPTRRRSKTATGSIKHSAHRDASLDDAFTTLGLSSSKASPSPYRKPLPDFDAAVAQARSPSPPPLIDYAARNEKQGRDSVRKRAESNKLHQMAKAAHEDKKRQDLVDAAVKGTTGMSAITQGLRRGMSDGIVAALATMPTRAAQDAPAVQGPGVYFNKGASNTAESEAFQGQTDRRLSRDGADAASETDDDTSDFVSAVHGETPAVELAPAVIGSQQYFDAPSSDTGHIPTDGNEAQRSQSPSPSSSVGAEVVDAGSLRESSTSERASSDTKSHLQAEATELSREGIDWVPSSRPAPSPPAHRMRMTSRAGSVRSSGPSSLSSPSSPAYSANARPFFSQDMPDGSPMPSAGMYAPVNPLPEPSSQPIPLERPPVLRERRDTNPFRSAPRDAASDPRQDSVKPDNSAAPASSAPDTPSPASSPQIPTTPAALQAHLGQPGEGIPDATFWPSPVTPRSGPIQYGGYTGYPVSPSQKTLNPYHSPPYSPQDLRYGPSHYAAAPGQWSSSPGPMDTAVGAWAENYFTNRDGTAAQLASSPTIGLREGSALQLFDSEGTKAREEAPNRSSTLPSPEAAPLPMPPSGAPAFPPLPLPPPHPRGRRRPPPHLSPHARSASYSQLSLSSLSYQVGRVHPPLPDHPDVRAQTYQPEGAYRDPRGIQPSAGTHSEHASPGARPHLRSQSTASGLLLTSLSK